VANDPYGRYAAIYDDTGQGQFSLRAWRTTRDHLRRLLPAAQTILDLACGTATAAVAMAFDGYRVVGLDLSREMLLEGRKRADDAEIPLLRADMQALPFADASFDLITAYYDAVNYLAEAGGLEAMLAETARVVKPGGLVVFDWLTIFAMQQDWDGLCRAEASARRAMIWEANWSQAEKISSLQATFFVPAADGLWARFDEQHDERGMSEQEVVAAASAAGLRTVAIEDFRTGRKATQTTRRALAVLRREVPRRRR